MRELFKLLDDHFSDAALWHDADETNRMRNAVKAELAKPEPEPVAWRNELSSDGLIYHEYYDEFSVKKEIDVSKFEPLYLSPQQQDPVGEVIESGGTLATVSTSRYGGATIPVGTKIYTEPHIKQEQSTTQEFVGWYCPHCETGVDPTEVTFSEHHQACGTFIGDAEPPKQAQATKELKEELEKVKAECNSLKSTSLMLQNLLKTRFQEGLRQGQRNTEHMLKDLSIAKDGWLEENQKLTNLLLDAEAERDSIKARIDGGVRVTASKYPDNEFDIHAQTRAVHKINATLILDEGVEL